MADDNNKETQVLVTEKTYEVDKKDFLNIQDVKSTWWNTTAGFMDTLRLSLWFYLWRYI